MRHAASKALYGHWSDLKRAALAPDRNDLDPSLIGAILQDVFILGAEPGGRWCYRVAGTRLSSYAGRELRGEPFERWWCAADRRDVGRMLAGVAQDDAPLVGGASGQAPDRRRHDFELLLLPLRHGGRSGQRMLGGLFPAGATARSLAVMVEDLEIVSLRAMGAQRPLGPAFGEAVEPTSAERRRAFRVIEGGIAG